MRVPLSFLLLTALTASLANCADENRRPPVAAIQVVLDRSTPAMRRAEIKRQLAVVCPVPLSDVALERAASYVESHRDAGAVAIMRDLSRLDAETRVCRGWGAKE